MKADMPSTVEKGGKYSLDERVARDIVRAIDDTKKTGFVPEVLSDRLTRLADAIYDASESESDFDKAKKLAEIGDNLGGDIRDVLETDRELRTSYGDAGLAEYEKMFADIVPKLSKALDKKRHARFDAKEYIDDELAAAVDYMGEYARFKKAGDDVTGLMFLQMAFDELKHAYFVVEHDVRSKHHSLDELPDVFRVNYFEIADIALSALPKTMRAGSPVYKEYRNGKRTVAFDQMVEDAPPGSKYGVSRWMTSRRGNTYRMTYVIPPGEPSRVAVFEVDVTDAVGKPKPEKE